VSREEKSANKALWPKSFTALMPIFTCRERISPARFGKYSFLAADFFDGLFASQLDSRTKMRPTSKGISGACHVGRWSKQSGSGLDRFRERLNQLRSGSSSGIHFSRDKRLEDTRRKTERASRGCIGAYRGTFSSDPT
jgi:hypothetical protein